MANTVSSNAYPVPVSLKQWATIVTLSTLTLGLTACGNQKQQSTVTNSDGSVTTIDNKDVQLLNVSYDISRDFYKDYNPLFVKHIRRSIRVAISASVSHMVAQANKHYLWQMAFKLMWSP